MPAVVPAAATVAFAAASYYLYAEHQAGKPCPSWEALQTAPVEEQATLALYALLGLYVFFKVVLGFVFGLFYDRNPLATTFQLFSTFWTQEKRRKIDVDTFIDGYNELYDKDADARNTSYQKLVNAYYELATQFYEWGWGQSFHFASRMNHETFFESIRHHEYYLAGRLNVKKGSKILDCGCGIGGPYRNIARFTQSHVTGITINEYQVQRGNAINKEMGLENNCKSVQGDFMNLPFPDNHFDAIYAIEATCHAPSREDLFTEIQRVLKPGGIFAFYDWCLTADHDPKNPEHMEIKYLIEAGDGLPDMDTCANVEKNARNVGFEIVEARDLVDDMHIDIPWYTPLTPSWNPLSQRFQFNPVGLRLTRVMLRLMEFLWLAPSGTCKVQTMLQQAAVGLARGGILKTFTPMWLVVCRKPLQEGAKSDGNDIASRLRPRASPRK